MKKKSIKLDVDGLILINKPYGLSSNHALTRIKKKFHPKKAGHTGTLDPLACGLLPICLGQATKFSSYLLDEDKTYRATLQLGFTSTTGDAEGDITQQPHTIELSKNLVLHTMDSFKGEITQTPPMFSALKVDGKPLYKYAREGLEIERKKRKVIIYKLLLLDFTDEELTIEVNCSKGTYIRSLAADIGNQLGTGAYLKSLTRISIGEFKLADALELDELDKFTDEKSHKFVRPIDSFLKKFNAIQLSNLQTQFLKNGMTLELNDLVKGIYRLYDENKQFIGLGQCEEIGSLKVQRLMNTSQ